MKKVIYRSDFLFPDTDFIIGAGSVLNIAGNYYEFAISKTEKIADSKALRSDWGITGQDLKNATNNIQIPTDKKIELCAE